jgi:hypothetical protein
MANCLAMTFKDFLETSNESLHTHLTSHHVACMNQHPSKEQIKAWEGSIVILKKSLQEFLHTHSELTEAYIVFEYELPRERGRRPDVLLLLKSSVVVLEFKEYSSIQQSFVDQVAAYARDLNHYQEYSHDLIFTPVLLLTRAKELKKSLDDVAILSPDHLVDYLKYYWTLENQRPQKIDAQKWLSGDYAPLPSLVQAARTIFQHEPLPSIRRAASAGIPETLKKLHEIAAIAKANKEHHLALITGVPGAGKTLVGISFVYEIFNKEEESKEAVLLSGNGPLVKVLQYALKNSVFVQDVHGFLKTYGGGSSKIPKESVFIYDEAQRAWDKARVSEKRGHDKSEPEDFLIIGSKKEWCLMVGLIGEGQEIYLGEEGGLKQWNEAITSTSVPWKVHCPEKLSSIFTNASETSINEELNLTQTLRSHLAEDVQKWVNAVLNGLPDEAASYIKTINAQGFDMYLTRDLEKAKKYVLERYGNDLEKRYGLVASSKYKILPKYSVPNDFMSTKVVREGPWFIDDYTSPQSCCQLTKVMTEFGCQGLELDFPIVCWENDFVWDGEKWKVTRETKGALDSFNLRKNSYRVLLSRGRDGMIVFVPNDTSLDTTYSYFQNTGLSPLMG